MPASEILPSVVRLSADEWRALHTESSEPALSDKAIRRLNAGVWLSDPVFNLLRQLAYGLGIQKIVFVQRALSDDIQGEYFFYPGPNATLHGHPSLDDWRLSKFEKTVIRTILKKGRAVIVLNATCDDACEILAHELGHHVVHFLLGMKIEERWAAPSNPGRIDSRFDDYCLEINDEFFAESFRFYLTGAPMGRIDLRPVLKRVCENNTRAYSLLRKHRIQVAAR